MVDFSQLFGLLGGQPVLRGNGLLAQEPDDSMATGTVPIQPQQPMPVPMPPQRSSMPISAPTQGYAPQQQPNTPQPMSLQPQGSSAPLQEPAPVPMSFFDKMQKLATDPSFNDGQKWLTNVGMGLMSGKNWGDGFARGIKGYDDAKLQDAQVAQQRLVAAQKQQQIVGSIALVKKAFPDKNLSDAEAYAYASNPDLMKQVAAKVAPSEAWTTYKDDNGNMFKSNSQTGDTSIVLKSDVEKSKPTSIQEYEYYTSQAEKAGVRPLSFNDYQNQSFLNKSQKQPLFETNKEREQEAIRLGLENEDKKFYIANGKLPTSAEKLTGDQANAGLYADRMRRTSAIMDNPDYIAAQTSVTQRGLGKLPNIMGSNMTSHSYKMVEQAERDFINATLRRESGAAISSGEFDSARLQYFPQPNDPPELIEQKRQSRQTAIDGISKAAGASYSKLHQPQAMQIPPQSQPAQSIPNAGKIRRYNPVTGGLE